jgi:hypothetical protein
VGKEDSVHISKYLKRMAPIITDNQLSDSAAYDILTFVTEGLTRSFVCGRRDSKLPFLKLWGFLSVSHPKTVSLKEGTQEIDKLFGKAYKKPLPF